MAAPMNAPLPPFFGMSDGMIVRLTALDSATGSLVAGVVISNVSVDVAPGDVEEAPLKLGFSPAYSQGDQAA